MSSSHQPLLTSFRYRNSILSFHSALAGREKNKMMRSTSDLSDVTLIGGDR